MSFKIVSKAINATEKIAKKNWTIHLVNESGIWKVWKFISSEEELATAIIGAKTEEERNALMEKEPELMTSDLAAALIRQNYPLSPDQGNYQRALTINQLAYKLAGQIGDKSATANVLINSGYIYYWLGTPEKSPERALEQFRKSLKIGEEFGFKGAIARALICSGLVHQLQGDGPRAAEYYEKGLELSDDLEDPGLEAQTLNNLAMIYRPKGNYAKSLELLLKSLKISESRLDSGEDWSDLAMALVNIGGSFQLQGNFEQALAYYQRSYEAAEKGVSLGDPYANQHLSDALEALGDIHLQQSNYSIAMDYFQKCLKLLEGLAYSAANFKDRSLAQVKIDIGNTLAVENNTLQAITQYNEAFKLADKAGDKYFMSIALWSLSKIYLLQNNSREALAFSERAIKIIQEFIPYPIFVTAAKAYRNLGQPEEARQALARAIDLTEQLQEQLAGGELDRQRFFEGAVTPYQAMIDLKIDQKQFREAFSFAQQAKGRTLLELLQKGRESISTSISPAEREQEQQLSRKIVSLNRQITDEKLKPQPEINRLSEFEDQLKKARLEFEAFKTKLYVSHPELRAQRAARGDSSDLP